MHLENQILNSTPQNKFLGLQIDDRLKFECHIRNLNKTLSSNCFALRTISRELGKDIARQAYFALIESHLRYGICFWGSCAKQLINTVFVMQKRAVRYMNKAKQRDSCRPLFVASNILTLPSLFILETVSLIHKKYRDTLNRCTSTYATRQMYNLPLPVPRTSQVHDSIVFTGRQLFNHLPAGVRRVSEGRKFGRVVRKLLVARAYYDVQEYFDERF